MFLPPQLTRNQIKHLVSLRLKKYRHNQRQYLAEGDTLTAEIVQSASPALRYVVCTQAYWENQTHAWRATLSDRVYCCDEATIASISSLDTPTDVLALLDMPAEEIPQGADAQAPLETHQPPITSSSASANSAVTGRLWLYLDGLRDPGNLGTIWRIADWFGVSHVYLSDDCVDAYNPKVIQASMGAFLRVSCRCRTLASLRAEYPAMSIQGTCISDGVNALAYAWSPHTLLVIGSESHGIRPAAHAWLDGWLSIPRGPHSSGAESLNAGVAAGILCASYLRAFS